jgi:hypothetical protein
MSRLACLEMAILLLGIGCGATPIGLDGGLTADSGVASDGGGPGDGGSKDDGGGPADGGVMADGGGAADGGDAADGGGAVDGGSGVDGGVDGGSGVDGGGIADGGGALDGGGPPDGGGLADGGGVADGGTADGGMADGGCVSDPGCPSPGPRCDPSGNDQIGYCFDLGGGCLIFLNSVPCPSPLQTCPVGATACLCPNSSCAPGIDRACASDGTLVTCAYDVPDGCGVYPAGGGVRCPVPQTCEGSPPSAGCTCPASGTTVGTGCSTPGTTSCSGNLRLVCARFGNCNIWQEANDCAGLALRCEMRNGSAECVCPANQGTVFYADAIQGSDTHAAPYATGLNNPPMCRFARLTDALSAANALSQGGTSATVIATGSPGSPPMRFGNESFPLEVGPFVKLMTDLDVPYSTYYVIDFNHPNVTAAVRLRGGALISGFTVSNARPSSPTVPADAVVVDEACEGKTIDIDYLRLNGAPPQGSDVAPLVNGIRISRSCPVNIRFTRILNMSEAGLRLEPLLDPGTTSALTLVHRSELNSNGRGILALSGALRLETGTIASNRNEGVLLNPSNTPVNLEAIGTTVRENAREGIRVVATPGQARAELLLDGVNLQVNGGSGLHLEGSNATATARGWSSVDENGTSSERRAGIVVSEKASFFSEPSVWVWNNSGHGLVVSGGQAELSGTEISSNQQHGIQILGGSVSLQNGSRVTQNGRLDPPGAGIRIEQGTLVLDGTLKEVEVSQNGLGPSGASAGPGIDFEPKEGSASLSAKYALLKDNGGAGLRIQALSPPLGGAQTLATFRDIALVSNKTYGAEITNALPDGRGIPITFESCRFEGNTTANLQVHSSSPLDNTGTASLQVLESSFRYGGAGVVILPVGASVGTKASVRFVRNTVASANNTGVSIHGTSGSSIEFSGNEIYENNMSSGLSFLGGIVLTGVPPEIWSFTGNFIRRNRGQQVAVGGDVFTMAQWNLSGPPDCSAPNRFCGYDWTAGRYGLAVGAAGVDARYNSWINPDPEVGKDYYVLPTGSVTALPDCGSGISECPH